MVEWTPGPEGAMKRKPRRSLWQPVMNRFPETRWTFPLAPNTREARTWIRTRKTGSTKETGTELGWGFKIKVTGREMSIKTVISSMPEIQTC